MKLISHRGNINGKKPKLENMPEYIDKALDLGYDVEIDVWYTDGFWLGHDEPQYKTDVEYLSKPGLWCHAKNNDALFELSKNADRIMQYFWHQEDDFTLTSQGYLWTYPGKKLYPNSICVLPELVKHVNITNCYGICSDEIERYR
tara:strand:+ start:363 stop:797 length:435 start_codon:yes stop_codon:yes gene_type:complete